ncbi:M23 family metallopeptidase [Chenggangzhangella methanolivorans]|uniref:M23 family metallopeptidase n=1 Tax=Chenggangzhangella methanolivorans TaxID=1437009 RepID=UPI003D1777D9
MVDPVLPHGKGSVAVKKGDQVARGQAIGRIGLSGATEFPHLHFALRRNGEPVDPYAVDGPSSSCGETKSAWARTPPRPSRSRRRLC